jgi:hypothetical protein
MHYSPDLNDQIEGDSSETALLQSFLNQRPAKRQAVKHPFTADAKAALLAAYNQNQWATAREAYGWAWNEIGLRVSYLTVWRFLSAQGLFVGDNPRGRRLAATKNVKS